MTLSRHLYLSIIAFGRSSGLQPVSSLSCCMYIRAGHPTFAWPYVGAYKSTSLMSSSLLLQQCPALLTCCRQVINHMYIRSFRLHKTGLLPSFDCLQITPWIHYMDSNRIYGEKARLELHNNAKCCLKQILEATTDQTEAVRPLPSYLIKQSN